MPAIKETFVIISWDATIQSIVAEWNGFAPEVKMKAALEQSLEIIKENQARRWLADTRAIKPFGKEIQRWINEDWMPRAVQSGIKYMAFVMPTSAISRLSITTGLPSTSNRATISAFFDNLEEGRKWLSEQ